jgi:hypothetical protein
MVNTGMVNGSRAGAEEMDESPAMVSVDKAG